MDPLGVSPVEFVIETRSVRNPSGYAKSGFSGLVEVLKFLANLPSAEDILVLKPSATHFLIEQYRLKTHCLRHLPLALTSAAHKACGIPKRRSLARRLEGVFM